MSESLWPHKFKVTVNFDEGPSNCYKGIKPTKNIIFLNILIQKTWPFTRNSVLYRSVIADKIAEDLVSFDDMFVFALGRFTVSMYYSIIESTILTIWISVFHQCNRRKIIRVMVMGVNLVQRYLRSLL